MQLKALLESINVAIVTLLLVPLSIILFNMEIELHMYLGFSFGNHVDSGIVNCFWPDRTLIAGKLLFLVSQRERVTDSVNTAVIASSLFVYWNDLSFL